MLLQIDNIGKTGLVKDIRPYRLAPEAWTNVKNTRFRNGEVQKFLGHLQVFNPPSVPPYWLLAWPQITNWYWIYAGLDNVYSVFNTTHADITRTAGVYTGTANDLWNGTLFGGVPILNNGVDKPQSWDGTANLQDLPNWPATTRCKVMRGFKQHLIAMDITKNSGADRYPYMVKWSHLADPGTVPTSWDETDPTVAAGENTLADTGGFVIDGLPLGDSFLVYKEDAVYAMRYVGGTFVWQFTKLFDSFGMIAQRCARQFEGKHFVVAQGDVVVHNGQSYESVIDPAMRKYLFENEIDGDNKDKIYVAPNYSYNEMWVCYPNTGATNGIPNRALVWNWKENTWGQRDLPDLAHIEFGIIDEGSASPIINTVTTIINLDENIIDGSPFSRTEWKLLGASPGDTKLYWMDKGNTFNGEIIPWYIERVGFDVSGKNFQGALKVDPTTQKFLRSVYPKVFNNGVGVVAVYVGGQESVEGSIEWQGPFYFDPSTGQIKIDCRVSGKVLALRFENQLAAPLIFYGYHLDMEIIGGPWQG